MKRFYWRQMATLLLAALFLTLMTGCRAHRSSRMVTDDGHHRLEVVVDRQATFSKEGDNHLVSFETHKLVIEPARVRVDDGARAFGIPSETRKLEVEIRRGVLTIRADGHKLVKVPI